MAVNTAPYPAFVKINYHSKFAPHVMTLPTRAWIAPSGGHPEGTYTAWDSTNIDADTMISDLVTLMKVDYYATSEFDRYEIWTKATPTSIPVLRAAKTLGIVGTATLTGWEEATQKTFFMRTASNNALKLVLLDSPSDNLFGKYSVLGTDDQNIIDEIMDTGNAWQARRGEQPIFFRDVTVTLNNRLRREYHLR